MGTATGTFRGPDFDQLSVTCPAARGGVDTLAEVADPVRAFPAYPRG
ncbi:hypothetical protein [Micromonospora echinofusca]|uniref:Uncharacterized protein n=1 Tax=Micromonospora echinofusca TaxID=47858 RepID=A0ABS3VPS6_MICEH|nr:hypothetical protein [Micromonospora echinofusca]MBO4206374.1 hypothetical protein [Micromonospora echinofusca]